MMRRALVLWSGGIDSTTTLYKLLKEQEFCDYEVGALFFDYGQLGFQGELSCVREVARHIRRVESDCQHRFLGFKQASVSLPDHFLTGGAAAKYGDGFSPALVPMRNSVFATIGYYHARLIKADLIGIGINSSARMQDRTSFPDCTQAWVDAMQKVFDLEDSARGNDEFPVKLYAPLVSLIKPQIAEEAERLDVPSYNTWACYFPKEIHGKQQPCGECEPCKIRKAAGLTLGGGF